MRSLVWFRRDLRITDNSALYHASRNSSEGIVGVFLVTPAQWSDHDDADCKIAFWMANLRELSNALGKLNIPLVVQDCGRFDEAPKTILSLADRLKCSALYFNKEYEVNELKRDKLVVDMCQANQIESYSFHDRVVVPPKEIFTKEGRFYSVFTPFRKVWDSRISEYATLFPVPRKQKETGIQSSDVPEHLPGFDFSSWRHDLWFPGEGPAAKKLQRFANQISAYQVNRDLPSVNGTSLLSPYLTAGVLSPRQCLSMALNVRKGHQDVEDGVKTWISELAWRDFYTHVLVGFSRVSRNQPFKLKTESISWRHDLEGFESWKQGRTGYPIVDAGMRQLNQTGWMHNRLRMITAMFLSKHLMIDWRWGEKYFMQQLIDGDLAANNGGWQWSASTGTDAVPYFRIFNPFSQSKRFDNEGLFIKRFCPELGDFSASVLHDADKLKAALSRSPSDYPGFVVDHKMARQRVLAAFKSI